MTVRFPGVVAPFATHTIASSVTDFSENAWCQRTALAAGNSMDSAAWAEGEWPGKGLWKEVLTYSRLNLLLRKSAF